MAGNYNRVDGVTVQRWEEDGDEPEEEYRNATVEELYFWPNSGELDLTITKDGTTFSITIPVKASKSWNSFVASLPTWDDE